MLSRSQMPGFGVELEVGQCPFRREALLCLVVLTPLGACMLKAFGKLRLACGVLQ